MSAPIVIPAKPAPESLSRGAGTQALRALLGAVALAALGAGAWYGYESALEAPIRTVRFTGDTARIAKTDLEQFARSLQGMPGGSATLGAVREAGRRLPWVREVTVRRRFPDALEVAIEAHVALARWNENQLVSVQGEVFSANHEGDLPRLAGPDAAAPEMARELARIVRALEPLGIGLAELRLSARGAWQVVLASGLVLELGRTDLVPRLERFVEAWPRIAAEASAPVYADLRYPNGFALRRSAARPGKS